MGGERGGPEASRREFLRRIAGGSAVATGASAAVGASGTAAAQETTQGGSSTESGGGTETVQVGPNGNYVFTPGTDDPLVIAPGTTVKFVWKSDGHNIHVDTQPDGANWTGHEPIEDTGFTDTHTFDTVGKYHYWCQPHKSLGMVADITVKEGGATTAATGASGPSVPKSAEELGIAAVGAMSAVLGFAYFVMKYGGDYGGYETVDDS